MTDLTPADVFERFAGDLEVAASQAIHGEALEAEARAASESADIFLDEAQRISRAAHNELSGLRSTVITAIEATSEDPEDRDVLETTMLIRGVAGDDIQTYFSHVDRLETEEHPIAIIATREQVGLGGLVQVGYGRSNYHVELNKTSRMPDTREVVIPVIGARGFGVGTSNNRATGFNSVFASNQRVTVNHEHPFDHVNFADSAEEVDATVERVVGANRRSIADHSAVRALNMPTIVAYGEEAVRRVAQHVGERNQDLSVVNEVALNDFGFEAGRITLSRGERRLYSEFFMSAVRDLLREEPDAVSGVRFWAPLQEVVNVAPIDVLEAIQHATPAKYSPDHVRIVTEDFDGHEAVEAQLRQTASNVHDLGVAVPRSGSVFSEAARQIRQRAVDEALAITPRHHFFTRLHIKDSLHES